MDKPTYDHHQPLLGAYYPLLLTTTNPYQPLTLLSCKGKKAHPTITAVPRVTRRYMKERPLAGWAYWPLNGALGSY